MKKNSQLILKLKNRAITYHSTLIFSYQYSCQAINFFNHAINFFSRTLIEVLTHILFATFFSLFMFHLQVDVVGPLLLNASLRLVLTTDWRRSLNLFTIDIDRIFWVLTIV